MTELEKIYDLTNLIFLHKGARHALALVWSMDTSKQIIQLFKSNGFQVNIRNQYVSCANARVWIKLVSNTESWRHDQYSDIILPNSACADLKRVALSRWRSTVVDDGNLFMY